MEGGGGRRGRGGGGGRGGRGRRRGLLGTIFSLRCLPKGREAVKGMKRQVSLGTPEAVGPGLGAPKLNVVPQPRSVPGPWTSPELKSRDHLPPPQPARERCEGRRPVTQPSEQA